MKEQKMTLPEFLANKYDGRYHTAFALYQKAWYECKCLDHQSEWFAFYAYKSNIAKSVEK